MQHLLPGVLAREQAGAVHDGLYLFRRGDDVVEVVQDGLDAVPELGVGLFPLQAPVVHSLAQLRGHAVEAALALLRRLHAQQAVGIHRAEGGQLGEEGAQLLLRGRLLGVDRLQIGPVYGVHVLHQGVQHGDGEVVTDGVLVAHVHHAAAGDGELGLGYAVQEGLDGFVVLPAVVVHEVEKPQARVPVAEFVAQAVVKLDVRLLHTADGPGDDDGGVALPVHGVEHHVLDAVLRVAYADGVHEVDAADVHEEGAVDVRPGYGEVFVIELRLRRVYVLAVILGDIGLYELRVGQRDW